MTATHTPTPWRYGIVSGAIAIYGNGATVARIANKGYPESATQDASHIVACVNAHDALTARVAELEAALRKVVQVAEPLLEKQGIHCGCFDKAHRLLVAQADAPLSDVTGNELPNPVAWMHNEDGRVDVIHDSVKQLWLKTGRAKNTEFMREMVPCRVEHYTIPLYRAALAKGAK